MKPKEIKWDIRSYVKTKNQIFRFLAILTLVLANSITYGQSLSTDVWHDGFVVLEQGDTLQGRVKYNLESGVVQFTDKIKGANTAYTAKNLLFFQINDLVQNRIRRFYSLPFSVNSNYESLLLFEVLVEGEMNLLAREKRSVVNKSDYYWGVFYNYGEEVLQLDYYILIKDKEFVRFMGKRKEFYALSGSKSDEIKKYVKSNHFNPKDRNDLARIVSYYNRIVDGK